MLLSIIYRITILVVLLFIIGVSIYFVYRPTKWKTHKEPIYTTVNINSIDDKKKIGKVYSRLFKGQAFFQDPKTSGITENVIKVRFDKSVEIIEFLVSLDHSQSQLTLVELAATINTKWGYDLASKENAIIHTSFYSSSFFGGTRKTDEKVFFTPNYGISMRKDDFIAIGAVVENISFYKRGYVSPEFVIYYRYLE